MITLVFEGVHEVMKYDDYINRACLVKIHLSLKKNQGATQHFYLSSL